MNFNRSSNGACGVSTAGLAFGGGTGSASTQSSEEFDGTSWSNVADLMWITKNLSGFGTQTTAIAPAGTQVFPTFVQGYDGVTWVQKGDVTKSFEGFGAGGTRSAGFIAAGTGTNTTNESQEAGVPKARVKSASTQAGLGAATWYPTGGSGFYETQPVDVDAPDGRWYRIEFTLTLFFSPTPQIPEINQNYGEGC